MFEAKKILQIKVYDIPVQWIPKIEIYYPDLPQFPIMYIHKHLADGSRLFAFPVSVSYDISDDMCTASFFVLCNRNDCGIEDYVRDEIEERLGLSDKITQETAIECCNKNKEYETFIVDLWQYVSRSYGNSIPYGRFYEEVYSIARFVSAWQPKTGRQSEMRMLYNFMSAFGESVELPKEWDHLECYLIPDIYDVKTKSFKDFSRFGVLDSAIRKTYDCEYTNSLKIDDIEFKVMPKAWKQNKDDFITNVSLRLFSCGILNEKERYCLEKLVDAFNRHAWRAAYFISSYMTIEKDYASWSKSFFVNVYTQGWQLKGYSEKVIACFLQQGFKKEEIIPIDTWIETFYQYPLGITERSEFYENFSKLGKLERIIWLASQANKTNMKNFFDLLWCQRYGTIGNGRLRGINPIACSECKLKGTCVGLKKEKSKNILLLNDVSEYVVSDDVLTTAININAEDCAYVCVLENYVPKKVYVREYDRKVKSYIWKLTDEFSGYILNSKHALPSDMVGNKKVLMSDFIDFYS